MRKHHLPRLGVLTIGLLVATGCPEPSDEGDELRVSPSSLTLEVGETDRLTVYGGPDGLRDVTSLASLVSMDESVATVDNAGLVTAVGEGMTQVVVNYEGLRATVDVTVTGSTGGGGSGLEVAYVPNLDMDLIEIVHDADNGIATNRGATRIDIVAAFAEADLKAGFMAFDGGPGGRVAAGTLGGDGSLTLFPGSPFTTSLENVMATVADGLRGVVLAAGLLPSKVTMFRNGTTLEEVVDVFPAGDNLNVQAMAIIHRGNESIVTAAAGLELYQATWSDNLNVVSRGKVLDLPFSAVGMATDGVTGCHFFVNPGAGIHAVQANAADGTPAESPGFPRTDLTGYARGTVGRYPGIGARLFLELFSKPEVDAYTIGAACELTQVSGFPKTIPGVNQWIDLKGGPSGTVYATSFDTDDIDEFWVRDFDFNALAGPFNVGLRSNRFAVAAFAVAP